MFSGDYAHRFPPTVWRNPSRYRASEDSPTILSLKRNSKCLRLFSSLCRRNVIIHSAAAERILQSAAEIFMYEHRIMRAYRDDVRDVWRPHGGVYPPRRGRKVRTDRYAPKARPSLTRCLLTRARIQAEHERKAVRGRGQRDTSISGNKFSSPLDVRAFHFARRSENSTPNIPTLWPVTDEIRRSDLLP